MIQDTTLTDGKYQFDISTVYYREDGSYVITLLHPSFGALPYHVPNEGEYADKWAELNEWRKDHEENFQPEPEPEPTPVPEPTVEEQATTILANSMRTMAAQTQTFTTAQFSVLAQAGVFEQWEAGKTYQAGYRLAHEGIVYEVIQEVTALENQPPNAEGMLAIYRPLSVDAETGEEPDGTQEHPYEFLYGMDVTNGCYYTYEGKLYLAKADMPACVWYPGTAGLWQWEEVGGTENE